VEGAFSARGIFKAANVSFYWTALRVDPYRDWPAFGWEGGPPLLAEDFSHWGMYRWAGLHV
jgi:hypothetical protein